METLHSSVNSDDVSFMYIYFYLFGPSEPPPTLYASRNFANSFFGKVHLAQSPMVDIVSLSSFIDLPIKVKPSIC